MLFWRILRTAAIFGVPSAFAASNSGLIQVTNVRSWSHPDSTRVIIQTTGSFDYRFDHANNPDRLFFDILHSRPWISQRRFATYDIGDRIVHRVRIAETSPGTTRIVFDLVTPADFNITKLEAPDRMVIEVRPLRFRNSPEPRLHQRVIRAPEAGSSIPPLPGALRYRCPVFHQR